MIDDLIGKIEIKTFKINQKPMTLAFFRQIFEDDRIINRETLEFQGKPLGIINYGNKAGEIYLLWLIKGELRKYLLDFQQQKFAKSFYQAAIDRKDEKEAAIEKKRVDYWEILEKLVNELPQLFIAC